MMNDVRQTQKKYCSRAMLVAIVAALCCLLIGYKTVGKGLVLGTVFSIINFIIMAETLPMKLAKSKGKTFAAALGSLFFRYLFLAIPLIVAIKFKQFNLIAVIVGIFMIQIVILTDHIVNPLLSMREKKV